MSNDNNESYVSRDKNTYVNGQGHGSHENSEKTYMNSQDPSQDSDSHTSTSTGVNDQMASAAARSSQSGGRRVDVREVVTVGDLSPQGSQVAGVFRDEKRGNKEGVPPFDLDPLKSEMSSVGAQRLLGLKGMRILIVGLAKTGVALCRLFADSGARVTVSDHKSRAELTHFLEQIEGIDVTYELGGHTPKVFLGQDLIILSPGISPQLKIFEYAKSHGVKVTGEFEFVSRFIDEPIIAVTGTNGKTTVCDLIQSFLKASGISCWVGGNYGEPLSGYLLQKEKAQVVIAEVSSFQLEHVEKFNPKNIVFTNLTESHLDRYKVMESYVNAKKKIFLNTSQETTSILNADDNAVVELARDQMVQRGWIFYFSRKRVLEPQIMKIGGAVIVGDHIHVKTRGSEVEKFYLGDMKILGKHSQENLMAAILAAREHGATKEGIAQVISTYRGLPHRLEYVRKVGGVKFYNDSKATNVHAVKSALNVFDENVILIMGGKDTNLTYTSLANDIHRKVKNLILVGEAKERINREIGDYSETFLIGTFEEAILIAYQKSRIGDVVLLAPACSSFDIFDNYIERGNYFKEIINKING